MSARWRSELGNGSQEILSRHFLKVELAGHQSERLKQALNKGGLQSLELVQYKKLDWGMDEEEYVSTTRHSLSLSVSKNLPKGKTLSFVQRMNEMARKKGYDSNARAVAA